MAMSQQRMPLSETMQRNIDTILNKDFGLGSGPWNSGINITDRPSTTVVDFECRFHGHYKDSGDDFSFEPYQVNKLVSRLYDDPTGQVHYVTATVSSQISIDNHATIILTLYNNTATYDHGTYYSPYTTGTYFERFLTADYGDSDRAEAQFLYNFVGYPRYDCDLNIDYEI